MTLFVGMWMGGVPPYGYRVENRKLVIDDERAGHVRWIFERFLEIGSSTELARSRATWSRSAWALAGVSAPAATASCRSLSLYILGHSLSGLDRYHSITVLLEQYG